ncbi:MAG: hypothetical protein IJI58_03125 [Bacilli bacterium]|nr:hypothetical protein [Bacilli bacterium]
MKKSISNIAMLAREISDKIGYPLFIDSYYGDEYYGQKYVYDKLKIIKTEAGITIYIGKTKVLDTSTNYYMDGNWTELISLVHAQIPSVLAEREIKEKEVLKKKKELKELEDYFKEYIRINNKENNVINSVNSSLNKQNISIVKEKRAHYTPNLIEDYSSAFEYFVFVIYYQGKKVLEFRDNICDIYGNIDYIVKEYESGNWVNTFKTVMKKGSELDELETYRETNNIVEELMKSLRKKKG